MGRLSSQQRKALPSSDFAVAGRKYPVNDKNHARAALSMVAAHGTPAEKAAVKAKVKKTYPGIQQGESYAYNWRSRENLKRGKS